MQLLIVDRNLGLDQEQRQYAERRCLFALSRFASRIERIQAVLSDVNGPRGGVDKSCRLTVDLPGLGAVQVNMEDESFEACVARAADRAGRAVARTIARNRW